MGQSLVKSHKPTRPVGDGWVHSSDHPVVQDVAASATHAGMQEALNNMNDPQSMDKIAHMVRQMTKVMNQEQLTDLAKHATYSASYQAFLGYYDAAESKYQEWVQKLPEHTRPAIFTYAAVFAIGMVLAIWRFVLYGTC